MKFQAILIILLVSISFLMVSCGDEGITPTVTPETEEEEMENNENNGNTETLVVAPDFSIKTWENDELNLKDYKDDVLVIFFFGNECPPCISIAPQVEEKLNKDLRGKENYHIIGIDQWDGNDAKVEGFKKKTGVEFPLGVMGSSVAKDYETTYDRLVVITKDGKIKYKGDSRVSGHLDDAVKVVKALLN